jgi:hypothetical protein
MQSLTIVCDRCSEKTSPAYNSRVKVGRLVLKRQPLDLCDRCIEKLVLEPMGLIPRSLLADDGEPTGPLLATKEAR